MTQYQLAKNVHTKNASRRNELMMTVFRSSFAPLLCFLVIVTAAQAQIPSTNHVFILVEENHSYSSVVGSSSMPYLNGLISQYSVATQYYANTHPSIGNYFMLTTGQIITNDSTFTGPVTNDNIVRQLLIRGKSWKSYAENLPSVGYTGGDAYPYIKILNPVSYLSDVVNNTNEVLNLVPF